MTAQPTIAAQPSPWRARKRSLFLSCAMGAMLAIAAPPRAASAQSLAFQGSPTVDFGGASIDRTVSDRDLITVSTPTAVINWSPLDTTGTGTIDFLPFGATATFQNDPANPDFFVLNRIVPTDTSRPIAFNGDVVSRLRDAAGVVTGPGGSVAFYSPGGIIVGSTATFDVGNLLLTTLDPVRDPTGDFVGSLGGLSLVGVPNSSSAIVVEPGARIDALAEGSYIAMAAPRIDQGGDVRVNGSAGYVAAEVVDLFIDDGLFDITVQAGTSVSTPISHTGSTGGPPSSDIGDYHNIYMVAVPKNQAITMMLSGSVGF
ncbi:MAG TPA: histidine kinase, partial [Allosphingosinicella sp.]